MIHEIFPRRLDGAFRDIGAAPTDYALFFSGGRLLHPAGRDLADLTRLADFPPWLLEREGGAALEYLFSIYNEESRAEEAERFFLFLPEGRERAKAALLAAGWEEYPPEAYKKLSESHLAFAAITARHFAVWREGARYCGRCGAKMERSSAERAAVCPECSLTVYPSIAPAVIVAVHDGERLLMAKSARASYRHFALIAGYVEPGETLEECVRREVAEETGLAIRNIRYVGSQPWGFSCTQMIAFAAELDGGDKIALDADELEAAAWFARGDIPLPPDAASIGGQMIRRFKELGPAGL